MSLLILFLLLTVGFAILWIVAYDKNWEGWMYFGGVGTVIFVIAFVIVLIILPISYVDSVNTIADLETFQEAVFENYVVTINATEQATIKLDMEKLLVSAENIKQSTNLSNRIVELRDKVTWYNENLKRLRTKNQIWWIGGFYKDVPDSLHMIILKTKTISKKD